MQLKKKNYLFEAVSSLLHNEVTDVEMKYLKSSVSLAQLLKPGFFLSVIDSVVWLSFKYIAASLGNL